MGTSNGNEPKAGIAYTIDSLLIRYQFTQIIDKENNYVVSLSTVKYS